MIAALTASDLGELVNLPLDDLSRITLSCTFPQDFGPKASHRNSTLGD